LGLSGDDLQDADQEIKRVVAMKDKADFLVPVPETKPSPKISQNVNSNRTNQQAGIDGKNCVICYERPKTHALLPCGHRCVCGTCKKKIVQCPLCRQYVIEAVKIYG